MIPRRVALRSCAALVAVAAMSVGTGSSAASARTLPRPDLQRTLDRLAREQHSAALALVEAHADRWTGAAGRTDAREPAAPDDRFGLESVTKVFVAAVVLQLVGERRLSLDDSVERWLPGRVRDGRRIRVRQLLDHSSGLEPGMPTELPPRSAQPPLLFRPGSSHLYANENYVVLGLIAEKVTGKSLEHLVFQRIIRPLGLRDTTYGNAMIRPRPGQRPHWLGAAEQPRAHITGDVGIVSTSGDVATFFRALLGGRLLGKGLLAEMTRTIAAGPHTRAGLGLFRTITPCGPAWGHSGNDDGYSDQVFASRDGSTVVVVAQGRLDEPAVSAAAEAMYCAAR